MYCFVQVAMGVLLIVGVAVRSLLTDLNDFRVFPNPRASVQNGKESVSASLQASVVLPIH